MQEVLIYFLSKAMCFRSAAFTSGPHYNDTEAMAESKNHIAYVPHHICMYLILCVLAVCPSDDVCTGQYSSGRQHQITAVYAAIGELYMQWPLVLCRRPHIP